MLTRRELLLAGGVLGAGAAPFAAALPRPRAARRPDRLRVGLLQSAAPFIDAADVAGSRSRAFAALRLLLERSLESHDGLDWIAAGAFALGHDRVASPALQAALALTPSSPEIHSLRQLAVRHRVQVSLGAAWQPRRGSIALQLLVLDAQGHLGVEPIRDQPVRPGRAVDAMSAACASRGLAGAWLAPARDPALPPTLPAITGGDTALLGRDGGVLAVAATQAETCVVGDVAIDLR